MGAKATQNYKDLEKLTPEQLLYYANIEIGILKSEISELKDELIQLKSKKDIKNVVKQEVKKEGSELRSYFLGLLATEQENSKNLLEQLRTEKRRVNLLQAQLFKLIPKKEDG